MIVVVLEFEKMPVTIMGPYVSHFLGYKQVLSLLHGQADPA